MTDESTPHQEGQSSSQQPQKVYQLSADELEKLIRLRHGPSSAINTAPIHTFTRTGLARQHEFNSDILNIIRPIAQQAPEDSDIKSELNRAVSLLIGRNELLVVADSDISVFSFYDQHKKAESTEDPILAAFLKKKEKEAPKQHKASGWKTSRFEPYQSGRQFFRGERAAWAPASLQFRPYSTRGFSRMEMQGTSDSHRMEDRNPPRRASSRDMCYECGRFGLFAIDCKFEKRTK